MKEAWRRTAAEIRRCQSAGGRAELDATVVEGYRLLERALRAGATLRRVLGARSLLERPTPRAQALLSALQAAGVPCDATPDEELAALTEGRDLGHLVGLADRPPEPRDVTGLAGAKTWLVAVGVRDPGNLGALVRTALALGANALVAVESSELFHPRAVRTSLGSCFKLPLVQRPDVGALLEEFQAAGVCSVAAVSRGGQPSVGSLNDARTAIWVGSEAFGLAPELTARIERRVSIPMTPGVDSLSVHVAAALLLYERQRVDRTDPSAGQGV